MRTDTMIANVQLYRAADDDVAEVAIMVGELLTEIMDAIGVQAFRFHVEETAVRLKEFIEQDKYFVFVARQQDGAPAGFVTLTESRALYAEGVFGTIPEFYVRPDYRSKSIGHRLAVAAKALGVARGWKRLEVTTPPLPEFERTLAFYQREGFVVAGGRKLKVAL